MRLIIALLCGLAVLTTGASASRQPLAQRTSTTPALRTLPRASAAGRQSLWGHIRSVTRSGGRWQMKFDPALLLFGTAAEQAAYEDTGSRDVPNDSYSVDESRRVYTYTVAPGAAITILGKSLKTITVGVAEFAQIMRGKNPNGRPLFGDPRTAGFWIGVGSKYPNPVASIDEQYHP